MERLKIKFHWLFIVYSLVLIFFKEYIMLISMFLSVVIHEFGHYLVAKRYGYRLNIINLMPYGASLSGKDIFIEPKHEIYIALAGPFTSLLIAILGIASWWIFPPLYASTNVFIYSNLSIFLVNLLPCFPLDGSRVLFCILKKKHPSKECFSIVKIVSIIVIAILTILYIISCFYTINYSLSLFVMFLLSGFLFYDQAPRYTLMSRTFMYSKKLSDGVGVNIKAISSKATLLELYKLLEPTSINYILVLDKEKNRTTTLKDEDIEKLIEKYPLDSILEGICTN